jgi:hypothetical protein
LIAASVKLVENRSRRMIKREDFGKPFALHASREIDEQIYARIRAVAPELTIDRGDNTFTWRQHPWHRLSRITSAVIAVATIDRMVSVNGYGYVIDPDADRIVDLGDQRRWFFGQIGYVLRDVIALPKPVPCRGWQGFWTLSPDVEARVRAQLPEVQRG